MDPFEFVPPSEYKDKNFFPCITDEYRESVRDGFWPAPKEEIEALKALALEEPKDYEALDEPKDYDLTDPFDEEPLDFGRFGKQPCQPPAKGSLFNLLNYFQGQGATSLVRCLKNGANDDNVTFQPVDPMTSFKGKHVMVACAFVPNRWYGDNAEMLCRLWVLSKEIASVNDFELLIVAKMRNGYRDNLAAFNQFLSGFPNRLAISFDHPNVCDEFCYNLGFNGEVDGILIDPDGKIVQDDLGFIDEYGASAFPFTDDSLIAATHEYQSLAILLRCDGATRLYRFGFPSETITVEQLSKKLVGLYLFRQGDKLRTFHQVYHLCQLSDKAKDVEPQFEIVLFCLPNGATDPATFELEVHELLKKMKPEIDASSWWVCPYDNSAGRMLSKVCRAFARERDGMVAVGPDGEFLDFCGGELIRNAHCEAYPFSMEAFFRRYVELAEQITLESLFTCGTTCVDRLVKQDSTYIDLKELQYKNVLLYVDSIPSSEEYNVGKFIEWCTKIKQYEPDVEVVFVSYTPSERGSVRRPEFKCEVAWIVCPYHPELSASLRHHSGFFGGSNGTRILRGLRPGTVVAFAKGGHIHVINVSLYLLYEGPDSNPFAPQSRNLLRDIYRQMRRDLDFMLPLPSVIY